MTEAVAMVCEVRSATDRPKSGRGIARKLAKLTRRVKTLQALVAALENECKVQQRVIAKLQKGITDGK